MFKSIYRRQESTLCASQAGSSSSLFLLSQNRTCNHAIKASMLVSLQTTCDIPSFEAIVPCYGRSVESSKNEVLQVDEWICIIGYFCYRISRRLSILRPFSNSRTRRNKLSTHFRLCYTLYSDAQIPWNASSGPQLDFPFDDRQLRSLIRPKEIFTLCSG